MKSRKRPVTTADELTRAREDTQAALRRAEEALATQKEARRQEQRAVVQPLKRLGELNHFADMIRATFEGGHGEP